MGIFSGQPLRSEDGGFVEVRGQDLDIRTHVQDQLRVAAVAERQVQIFTAGLGIQVLQDLTAKDRF